MRSPQTRSVSEYCGSSRISSKNSVRNMWLHKETQIRLQAVSCTNLGRSGWWLKENQPRRYLSSKDTYISTWVSMEPWSSRFCGFLLLVWLCPPFLAGKQHHVVTILSLSTYCTTKMEATTIVSRVKHHTTVLENCNGNWSSRSTTMSI